MTANELTESEKLERALNEGRPVGVGKISLQLHVGCELECEGEAGYFEMYLDPRVLDGETTAYAIIATMIQGLARERLEQRKAEHAQ